MKKFKLLVAVTVLLIMPGCSAIREYQAEQQRKFDEQVYISFLRNGLADDCARHFAFDEKIDNQYLINKCYQYRYKPEVVDRVNRLKKSVEGLTKEQIAHATDGHLSVGMTYSEVRLSFGKPDRINDTNTQYGTHSQWVYEDVIYVYFEDGKVTAWQNYR